MPRGPNYTFIPHDWIKLEHIISDLSGRILNESGSLSDYILKDGSRAYTGTGAGFKDDDAMGGGSSSAVATASQQSIKAYVDATAGGQHFFKTITGISNDVVADAADDTLTLSSGNSILGIVGTTATDTITFTIDQSNIDHGGLGGLTDVADHPGYLDLAGTRDMTGSLTIDTATPQQLTLANGVGEQVSFNVSATGNLEISGSGGALHVSAGILTGNTLTLLSGLISDSGSIAIKPNGDNDDYLEISTTANQTKINFVGQNGLITADSGTIDFDNEILTTTGDLRINTDVLYVDSGNGRVGVGTATPNTPLEVAGVLRTTEFSLGDDANHFRIQTRSSPEPQIRILGVGNNFGTVGLGELSIGNGASLYGNIAAPSAGMIVEGNVGIGTTGPDRKLDVLDATDPQLRLTHTDGTVYTDFQTDASGNLSITASGGIIDIAAKAIFNPGVADGASAVAYTLESSNTLATTGSRWLSVVNNGTEVFALGKKIGYSFGSSLEIHLPSAWTVFHADGRLDFDAPGQSMFFKASNFFFEGALNVNRTGQSSSTATQKDAFSLVFQNHLWNGSSGSSIYSNIRSIASTTVNLASRLAFRTGGASSFGTDGDEILSVLSTGRVGVNTATPEASLQVVGDIRTDGLNFTSATELTISSGEVTVTKGHHSIDTEADAANDDLDTINGGDSGEILLILSEDSARDVRIVNSDGVTGNIYLKHQTDSSPFSFTSPSGAGAATRYSGGGFYNFATADVTLDQGSLTQTFGTANVSYAAHASIITRVNGTVDTGTVSIVVSGTSVDDEANRTAADSETILVDITAAGTNGYHETVKKWIGTITFTLTETVADPTAYTIDFNYGFSKYEDFANQNFTVTGIQIAGQAGASDSNFNLILFHHSSANWTYAATGFVPGGTQLANMNDDHVTEIDLVNGEPFAWKRTDLNTSVVGNDSEGVVVRIDTSAAKAVESMSGIIWVHTQPAFSYMSDTKQHLIFMKHGPNWLEL